MQPPLLVAHIWGTGKARGQAYGELLKSYIPQVMNGFYQWVDQQVEQYTHKFLPKEIADVIAQIGLDAALDIQYELMKSHMSADVIAEVEGIAEGVGLSYMEVTVFVVSCSCSSLLLFALVQVMRFQMIPELVKAHCSMVGAWGTAVNASYASSLLQLRALDWATDSPLQRWPLVTVFHASVGRNAFATLGWPGFNGALTGMSDAPFGICEKVQSSLVFSLLTLCRCGCPTRGPPAGRACLGTICCATFWSMTAPSTRLSLACTLPNAPAPFGWGWGKPSVLSLSLSDTVQSAGGSATLPSVSVQSGHCHGFQQHRPGGQQCPTSSTPRPRLCRQARATLS